MPKSGNGKIDPGSVAFDVDGVIADTMHLFLDIAREEFHINGVKYEDITCYMLNDCLDIEPEITNQIIDKILTGDYTPQLKPILDAPEVLGKLSTAYGPVLMVTARPFPGPIPEWIEQVLNMEPDAVNLVTTGSFEAKAEVLLEHHIRFFVEDRLETCFLLKNAGIEPVLFKQPWNREPHPFREVATWQELESCFIA